MSIKEGQSLLDTLAKIAPAITFNVAREYDPHFRWDGDGPDPVEEGYLPHDVTVYATAGNREGIASMVGHYQKPGEVDDLGGYLPQMLEEAVNALAMEIQGDSFYKTAERDIAVAVRYLKREMAERYAKQMSSERHVYKITSPHGMCDDYCIEHEIDPEVEPCR